MTDFNDIHPTLAQALEKRGYHTLTPVQEAVLESGLRDADLLVSAQTGSGKTVAFGLALAPTLLGDAERFAPAARPLALAVAPTRELALQVKRELEWLYGEAGARLASCVGGMDMREERRELERGAHIVVGTPGRLRDHIERHSLDMSGLRAAVLDEADEMLDLGFRDDLEFILAAAPAERRTLMFSATVPHAIATLARGYQRDAVRVRTTAEREQHGDIEYRALTVAPSDRENAIINVLRHVDAKNALVFCHTRAAVNHMTSRFTNRGFPVVALSGELSQAERTHALQALRDTRARVCIATDVAARGLDLPDLELVIHADIPKNRESLLHRSGRTGRAGRKGVCVLIVPYNERRRTERLLDAANVKATWTRPPSADDVKRRDRERLLDDPTFGEALSAEDAVLAGELLSRHGAEKVAGAFLRLHAAGRSAPEELLDVSTLPEPREKKRRDDFTNGAWFALSVGRNQKAEARWLLPMLCRFGQLTKHDIGSIKVQANETRFELIPDSVKRFLDAVGPTMTLEKTITVSRVDGPVAGGPAAAPAQAEPRVHRQSRPADEVRKKPFARKKPYAGDRAGGQGKPKRDFAEPRPMAAAVQAAPAERTERNTPTPGEDSRAERSARHEPKFGRRREGGDGKRSGPGKGGFGALKRKKPRKKDR